MRSSLVVGRDAELVAADRFLDAVRDSAQALVLEGEPGIGKTTVWRETARRARGRGYLVVSSRPAQAEASLSFAGLGDLLAGLPETALGHQRHLGQIERAQRPIRSGPCHLDEADLVRDAGRPVALLDAHFAAVRPAHCEVLTLLPE